mgnify:CR=1 FL=1
MIIKKRKKNKKNDCEIYTQWRKRIESRLNLPRFSGKSLGIHLSTSVARLRWNLPIDHFVCPIVVFYYCDTRYRQPYRGLLSFPMAQTDRYNHRRQTYRVPARMSLLPTPFLFFTFLTPSPPRSRSSLCRTARQTEKFCFSFREPTGSNRSKCYRPA